MQFYDIYRQTDPLVIREFVESQPFCYLATAGQDGPVRLGVFNPSFDGDCYYLHLNKNDEQVTDLKTGRAKLVFHEFLAVIPSHWVDEHYAGAATSYYRYVEFDCDVEILERPDEMVPVFQRMMEHIQPEGGYEVIRPDSPLYEKSFGALAIGRFSVRATRTKWKLGQNRPQEIRRRVAAHLRVRAEGRDVKAAEEVLATMKEHENADG